MAALLRKVWESVSRSSKATSESSDRRVVVQSSTGAFSHIPFDVFMHILQFLEPREVAKLSLVCKYWKFLVSDNQLWLYLLQKEQNQPGSWDSLVFAETHLQMGYPLLWVPNFGRFLFGGSEIFGKGMRWFNLNRFLFGLIIFLVENLNSLNFNFVKTKWSFFFFLNFLFPYARLLEKIWPIWSLSLQLVLYFKRIWISLTSTLKKNRLHSQRKCLDWNSEAQVLISCWIARWTGFNKDFCFCLILILICPGCECLYWGSALCSVSFIYMFLILNTDCLAGHSMIRCPSYLSCIFLADEQKPRALLLLMVFFCNLRYSHFIIAEDWCIIILYFRAHFFRPLFHDYATHGRLLDWLPGKYFISEE